MEGTRAWHVSAPQAPPPPAPVRKTTFFPLIAQSLGETLGEPTRIRRAKAFAHLLDQAGQVVLPYELVAGSVLGTWPLDTDVPSFDMQLSSADRAVQDYIDIKSGHLEEGKNRIAIGFKKNVSFTTQRWALMARDHYDASIRFLDMQEIIRILCDKYKGDASVEAFEIGRVIERHFEYDYGEKTMRLIEELPWEAANHLDLNYGKCVQRGFGSLLDEVNTLAAGAGPEKEEFYSAARITLLAAIRFIERYAATIEKEREAADPARAMELGSMAEICRKIATQKPETFREALQLVWMTHIIGNLAGGSALSFARFDQYMRPFYEKDLEDGRMTREQASELLACAFLKVNEPKMRTVQSLCLGGVKPDGTDGASDLTRCCIETIRALRLPYPNVSVRIDTEVSPTWLLDEAVQTIQVGFGMPMILNDRLWVPNLTKLGYPVEVARDYYNMGCVEIMIQGRQANWGGAGGVNFVQIILDLIEKSRAGDIHLPDFEAFMREYLQALGKTIDRSHAAGVERLAQMRKNYYDPFASVLIDDCLKNGIDMFQGGAALPAQIAIGGSGLGTAADSLSAIKTFVYDRKQLSLDELSQVLRENFTGNESLRAMLGSQAPAYGNDLDTADDLAKTIFDAYCDGVFDCNEDKTARFVNVLFSYNSHVTTGEVTGATPNGRLKGKPLSDCIGPSQGKDVHGPTKLMNSVLKLDFSKVTGAFALNVKINPSWAQKPSGKIILSSLIHAYLQDNGPQMQFNMQRIEDLKAAQAHPEQNRDIVVRIAGYCEYFVNLDHQLQNEIISRTAHELAN